MFKHSQPTTRRLAVATIIVGLLSCLTLPTLTRSCAAAAKAVVANPAPAPSSLQGEQAVQQLKAQGLYDSLQAAFGAARLGRPAREVTGAPALDPAALEDIFTQEAKLTGSDGFGTAVAISGDTAVVGAFFDTYLTGAAYVFVRNGTTWSLQQKLTVNDRDCCPDLFFFGGAVAISGNTIVVGVSSTLVGGDIPTPIAAYVFSRYHGLWTQSHKLTPHDGMGGKRFGSSVAISGDTIVVGAPRYGDNSSGQPNAVYVYRLGSFLHGNLGYLQQKLVASDEAAYNGFGTSVAISGDTLVVGAPGKYFASIPDGNAAYVFVRSGGVWTEQQKLTADDGMAQDNFGSSVAVAADTIVVGAATEDGDDFPLARNPFLQKNRGAAYVFVRSNGSWSQQQKLIASDGAANDEFGSSVAIAANTIVVGAVYDDNSQGSAYVFVRSGTTWAEQQKLMASDGGDWYRLGHSVAISGHTIIVGTGNDTLRSAYVFVKPWQRALP